MTKTIETLCITIGLACVFACSSDDDSQNNNANPDSGTTGGTSGTSGDASVGQATITIENLRFEPENLEVEPGQTVTVINLDGFAHSVTSQATAGAYTAGEVDGISFDTGTFSSDQRTFVIPSSATPGTVIPYFCTIHLGLMSNDGQITIRSP